ncbi:MAG: sulfatase [Legionella sp.]|nr:MAG: sulfatase [Legionella sp.]PJD97720.1 MAG: sulfatase [Legionella sp.]
MLTTSSLFLKIKTNPCLRFVGWFFFFNALFFWLAGLSYLHSILHSPTLFKNMMADYSSPAGQVLILFFTGINFISYMTVLAFIPAIVPALVALFYPKKTMVMGLSWILATLSLLLLIIDVQVYALFKFHLNQTIFGFIFSKEAHRVFNLSSVEQLIIYGVAMLILLVEWGLAYGVWYGIILPKRLMIGRFLVWGWSSLAVLSYFIMMLSLAVHHNNLLIQQASNLPLYNQLLGLLIPQKNAEELLNDFSEAHYMQAPYSHETIQYPLHPLNCQRPDAKRPYNIFLIMVDSLRFDSLQYMPYLQSFANESWQFLHHYSGGNSTQAGLFSLFYSIPGTYWNAALEQHVAPVLFDWLTQYQYKMRVIYSAEMRNPPLDKTIYQRVPDLAADGSLKKIESDWDRDSTDQALQFLRQEKKQHQALFLNVFYNAPHAYCNLAKIPIVYQPYQRVCSRIGMDNRVDREPYYNNYLNTVHFIDEQLQLLLKAIKDEGYWDNSIVIITSDHGQEFNENHQNYWGHASNYSVYQTKIPLLIHWPKQSSRKIAYRTSSYDLMPTLATRLFHCTNPRSDYSIGQDLLTATDRKPFIIAGSYATTGIIEPDRLTTIHTSGAISMTDQYLMPLSLSLLRKSIVRDVLLLQRTYYQK